MKNSLSHIWQAVPYVSGMPIPDQNYYKSIKDAQIRVNELEDKKIYDRVELKAIKVI